MHETKQEAKNALYQNETMFALYTLFVSKLSMYLRVCQGKNI